jgi:DNA-binding FadR family transcriptional regulator
VARQGSGTVVRDFRHAAGPELVPELLRQARDPLLRRQLVDDLLLMRRQMFAVVFARLADGVSPLARAHVAAAVDVLAALGAGAVDSAAFAEADLAVVAALLDATESPVLALCLNPVNDVVRRDPDLHGAMYADPRPHVQGWLEVCDWLAAPDPGGIAGLLAAVDARDAATVDRLAG